MTIKDRRKDLGLVQRQVATRCGVSVRAYQSWENGESGIPSGRLVTLARILGWSVDQLLRAWAEMDAIGAETS